MQKVGGDRDKLASERFWRFINFLKSEVKWCGTHQRGEAKQIWKRAEHFIWYPLSALPFLLGEPEEAELMSTQFQFILLPSCYTDTNIFKIRTEQFRQLLCHTQSSVFLQPYNHTDSSVYFDLDLP